MPNIEVFFINEKKKTKTYIPTEYHDWDTLTPYYTCSKDKTNPLHYLLTRPKTARLVTNR